MLIGITGSHGFLGQNLISRLSKNPDAVIKRFDKGKHDLFDIGSLEAFVRDLDALYHIAGANRAENADLVKVNILGSSNLLDAIKLYGKPNEIKFIFASSFQVYAPLDTDCAIGEETLPDPRTFFGITKKCAEDIIRISGINSKIIRISNVYGPHCRPFYNSVISTFCELAQGNRDITVNGDGRQTRDFIFIDDVVSAMEKLIQHPSSGTEIYNLCGGVLFSLNDIIRELEKVSGRKIKVVYNEDKQPLQFQRGDNNKIKKAFDWDMEIPLKMGLKKTYLSFQGSSPQMGKG